MMRMWWKNWCISCDFMMINMSIYSTSSPWRKRNNRTTTTVRLMGVRDDHEKMHRARRNIFNFIPSISHDRRLLLLLLLSLREKLSPPFLPVRMIRSIEKIRQRERGKRTGWLFYFSRKNVKYITSETGNDAILSPSSPSLPHLNRCTGFNLHCETLVRLHQTHSHMRNEWNCQCIWFKFNSTSNVNIFHLFFSHTRNR